MRAVVEGRLDPAHEAFQTHVDRCLGCRACETVCPSGVEYGHLLERARHEAVVAAGAGVSTRLTLWLFERPRLLVATLRAGRLIRATGLPALLARFLPEAAGRLRLAAGMLASTAPINLASVGESPTATSGPVSAAGRSRHDTGEELQAASKTRAIALLDGCVQDGLFSHVNAATQRVLSANGFAIIEAPGQACCGALHAHAGALEQARSLARKNIDAFGSTAADQIIVNAAGCGATMKDYGELLADDEAYCARAAEFSGKVKDISEILASHGLITGAPVPTTVAYDAPCHLLHGQGVDQPPLELLRTIPHLSVTPLSTSSECCGGAGTYAINHPELGSKIGNDKVDDVQMSAAELIATPNPGCIMQIGAGLRSRGHKTGVIHPIELLDESYRRAGHYGEA